MVKAPLLEVAALDVVASEVVPAGSAADLPDSAALEQLDQLLAMPPEPPLSQDWWLGIDLGTTGISAVLLNQSQSQLYPLYWQPATPLTKKKFRLPTAVTLTPTKPSALPLPTIRFDDPDSPQLRLSDWKPYLRVAVPHHSPHTSIWEPVLQWSTYETVPLRALQEALQQLLTTLNPERASFMPTLTCGALGLETAAFQSVLANLSGIVVGYPSNWSDTYSFNLREAILQAGLVRCPDQITFIDDAIATLLSALPATDGRPVTLSQGRGDGHLHNANWQGMTLILTAGASLTELVLVNLPAQLQSLNHTDFYVRSLPYAGQGIDQDIVTQLLYPALLKLTATGAATDTGTACDFVLEPFDLKELNLESSSVTIELDSAKQQRLQQQLISSRSGQLLLTCARTLKLTLQHQSHFTLKSADQRLTIERQELISQVLLPYVQCLNRELNALLAQTNTTAAAVKQVICTGGTTSFNAIARWLRQKLPNATIVQDTYPRSTDNCIPSCSRIAYGLATLPLHPQVIDQARHRFSDYFLLRQLLSVLSQQPLHVETIFQLLEQRGIDTEACRFRILALLEAHLPPGFVPAQADAALLTPESAANPDYQAIGLTPLFTKQSDRTYQLNHSQWSYLQHYLETLLADTEQRLDQPLEQVMGFTITHL